MERRLAAILAADVVGYSRLMQADEAGTLAALKARRSEILQPLVAKHHGRIVKLMGDGVLVEFASVVNAVTCAVELQGAMEIANRELPEAERIILRVGVNLGDVVVEGSDLYGDGVNIAARLEALAEPGSVFVSAKVHEEIVGKLRLNFEDLGAQKLKNITGQVHVYRISRSSSANPGATPGKTLDSSKPSIAVLPFTNMSGDAEQQYFSDGITEDVITELSRFRDLLVIARNSSFRYRDKEVDIRQVGRDLDVDYVIEGSVRRSGDRLRITAQLIDARSGSHVWADRYDRETRDIFAVQEEMARSIAATVGGRVELVGLERAARASPTNLKVYDLILKAKMLAFKYTKQANAESRELARQALEIDLRSAKAYSYIGYAYYMEFVAQWVPNPREVLAHAYEFQKKAVALDEGDIEVRWKFGQVLLAMGRHDEARVHFERALEINPNDTEARCQFGLYLDCMGQHEEAIEQYDIAKLRNPFDPSWLSWIKGIAYFGAQRYEKAIAQLNQIVDPINEVHGWLAASYAHAGRDAEAKAKLRQFLDGAEQDLAVFPGRMLKDWDAYWRGAMFYRDERDFEHLFEALRKAGLPE
jgi:TolB-like protein/class 3 adenylate cyclase/Tfp pilus assembly protein PilF